MFAEKIGKYQNALSGLCGVDYAYMQGDPDVDAMIELISVALKQDAIIEQQKAEINVLKKLLCKAEVKIEALEKDKEQPIKDKPRKEFWERLKKYMDIHGEIEISDVDSLLDELEGDY